MPLVDFIRHGETQARGILLGRTDAALSEAGWQQFERQTAGRTWASVTTSPLRRASDAAEYLAQKRDLKLKIDSDWAEMDFGDWDGRPLAELREDGHIAAQLDALYADPSAPSPPSGESWDALSVRVARALDGIAGNGNSGPMLVVTHGGPIRAAISLACGIPLARTWAFRIDYGTRLTLRVERLERGEIWGEIIEVVQP